MGGATRTSFIPYGMGRDDRLDMLISRGLHSIFDTWLGYHTKTEIGDMIASISSEMVKILRKYGRVIFSLPGGDHTHSVDLPHELKVNGIIVHTKVYPNVGISVPVPANELFFRIICAVLLSKSYYIPEACCRQAAELIWNISSEFIKSNMNSSSRTKRSSIKDNTQFDGVGVAEGQSSSTQELIPRSMEALILITNMVLSNASKEEVDRAANYAVSVIAVEKSVNDCVEAKRANGVDELMKKYYPT